MFLIDDDYSALIQQDKLTDIINSDSSILERALPAAIEEAAGYIRTRYDEDKVFKSVTTVESLTVSNVKDGDRFYAVITDNEGNTTKTFYTAIADGGTDLTDTDYFEQKDSRNAKLVDVVVDIVLYNIHSRTTAKTMPTLRRVRYDGDDPLQKGGAIGWLKNVQKGTIEPYLQIFTDTNGDIPQNTETLAHGETNNTSYGF